MNNAPLRPLLSHTTRRRILAFAIATTALALIAVAGSPVAAALRHAQLAGESATVSEQMGAAQAEVGASQQEFEAAAAAALAADDTMGRLIGVVNPALLVGDSSLIDLIAARSELQAAAGIHEQSWEPGTKVLFAAAATPRLPAPTTPQTLEGLAFAVERGRGVVTQYTAAASTFRDRAEGLRADIDRVYDLIEDILASAAKYGTSREVLGYTKADVNVKLRLNAAVGGLDDSSVDPVDRYKAFADAVADLKKSHALAVAEEARLEKQKKDAEEKAAADARKAEEDAKRAAEDAARREEESRKPTPSPTATPTLAPTPPPAPED